MQLFYIFAARPRPVHVIMRGVCPSVTFVHSVEMNKHIFKKNSLSGSQAILVFPYQTS